MPFERFIKVFRLGKEEVQLLIEELADFNDNVGGRRDKIPFYMKVLIFLNFVGSGSFQTGVGRDMNLSVSQPVVSRIVNNISHLFTVHLLPRYVKFPTSEEGIAHVKAGFLNTQNFPNTIGAIDCTHIAIITPKVDHPIMPAAAYLNRKGYYSINMQGICDSRMVFLNVNCRYPGATHDSAIWEMSTVYNYLRRRYEEGVRNTWLIGDSGYPLQPWLMTPINGTLPHIPERLYTDRHCQARNVIERAFGSLKQRFKCLMKTRVLYYKHPIAAQIAYSCVILHNICRLRNLPEIEEEEEEEEENDEDDEEMPIVDNNINILMEGRLVRQQ
jgi:hypothetical protein